MDNEPIPNPYQTEGAEPQLRSADAGLRSADAGLHSADAGLHSAEAQRLAAAIARWQRATAILLWLAAAMVIGGFLILLLASGEGGMASLGSVLCSGVMVLLCYILPAVLLWRAAGAASHYGRDGGYQRLSGFTRHQLGFWRSMGYLVLIAAGLWLAMVVIALFGVVLMIPGSL